MLNYRISRITNYLGRRGNDEVSLVMFPRASVASIGRDPELWVGGNCIIIGDSLPLTLSKLIPHSYGNATLEQWEPFIYKAIVQGLI